MSGNSLANGSLPVPKANVGNEKSQASNRSAAKESSSKEQGPGRNGTSTNPSGDVVVRSRELTKVTPTKPASNAGAGLSANRVGDGKSIQSLAEQATAQAGKPIHPFFQRYLDDNAYFVRPGDTFESIAHSIFGDRSKAADLRRLNLGPATATASQPKPGDRIRLVR